MYNKRICTKLQSSNKEMYLEGFVLRIFEEMVKAVGEEMETPSTSSTADARTLTLFIKTITIG